MTISSYSLFHLRFAGVYARVTAVMEWIVKHIQNGECHYVQKYIDEKIRRKRKNESLKVEALKQIFNEIHESKNEVYPERPCECPKCHKNVPSRVTELREDHCFSHQGSYMTEYRQNVERYCKINDTDDRSNGNDMIKVLTLLGPKIHS